MEGVCTNLEACRWSCVGRKNCKWNRKPSLSSKLETGKGVRVVFLAGLGPGIRMSMASTCRRLRIARNWREIREKVHPMRLPEFPWYHPAPQGVSKEIMVIQVKSFRVRMLNQRKR
ncbi:Cytochrome c oxidase assembly protein CtaG/Cox11 [Macrophomina phaseolina MS6]|uniref:Cytochrome c oxidase assembly protein CtaG/Cox11 n=1 Tax=Macrophomina phaseolina (strain MS6) TaxID=1126212 RepID=K2RHB2_MACPH|nr:Cytochrome c oxidase assembly protein CtaG/Cox11 [Macrophomina phaseolina MS6]